MCGRYTITRQQGLVEDFEAVLDPDGRSESGRLHLGPDIERNPWWKPRFNVAPTQDAPVVTLRDGVRTLEMMRWGLVPFWAGREGTKPPLMINARVESVQQKPMFRDALGRRRCLVPADGFFEWKKLGKTKQPMWIHPGLRNESGSLHAGPGPARRGDSGPQFFAFAGLWARAKTDAGDVHSFTIVTGPANELVAPIHDRMPVILDRSLWAAWLDPSLGAHGAYTLLAVPPAEHWVAEPVSPWVNVADHDDEQCIAPIGAPPPPVQGSLF